MLSIDVDSGFMSRQAEQFGLTERQQDVIRARSLRKLQKHIETSIKREASKKLRIPQKSIADRFFSNRIQPGDEEMQVWVGTWAVSPFSIGSPSQNTKGVRVGRRSYPGAFLAEIYSSETKVWIRKSSKHFSPELYPTKSRSGDRGLGSDPSGRFPVLRAAVPIDGVVEEVLIKEGDSFAKQFEVIYMRELNYEINVKGNA